MIMTALIIVPEPTDCGGRVMHGEIDDVLWPDYSSPYRTRIYPDTRLRCLFMLDDGIGWVGVGAWLGQYA